MKLNNKTSKIIGIIIGIVLFISLIAGITYAVYKWTTSNTNISISTTCFNVTGSNTYSIQGSNMLLFDEDDIIDTTNNTITYKNGMIYAPFEITRGNCNIDTYYEINVNVTTLSEDYTNGSIKYKVIEDMTGESNINNPLNQDLEYNTVYEGSITHTGTIPIYYKNLDINTTEIPAVIFYIDGDLVEEDSSNLIFNANVEVTAYQGEYVQTAADFIEYKYDTAIGRTTVTNNSITYNLVSSVGLMNDRLGGTTTSLDGGDIRYYGANPNNYVWLGDTYTSAYTFSSNETRITRTANSKKLWRIIGVFDGRLKLIQADPISTTNLSWDTSRNATGYNAGNGINEWSEADLMKLLNPGYESNRDLNSSNTTITVNNSLYWTKGTGTVYIRQSNATTANVSFANTGLSIAEKNMIDTATWYLGAYNGDLSYVNVQYAVERQSTTLGKICTSSYSICTDAVTRTSSWEGKVGLMYPSDYGYAVDLNECQNKTLSSYSDTTCQNDWLKDTSASQWTISPRANSSNASIVFRVNTSRNVGGDLANYAFRVRPVVFLKSGVTISGGDGSESNPYVLSLS